MITDTMVRWAIRHIPTGGYLPEVGHLRMGYTGTEPEPMKNGAFSPRLFAAKGHAKRALTWWLKGITSRTVSQSWDHEYDEVWHTVMPVSSKYVDHVIRRPEDLEIVEVFMACEVSDGVRPTEG